MYTNCGKNVRTLFIQTSQAEMCKNNEFDTIYHEHINFFNVRSMKTLVEKCGLKLHDVVKKSNADAVAMSDCLHFNRINIKDIKKLALNNDINVRK